MIYLDIIIIFDTIINSMFLIFINKVMNNRIVLWRIIISSLLSIVILVLSIYSSFFLKIMRIGGGIIIVLLASNIFTKSQLVINISLFYALNFALVGVLSTFRITEWYLIFVALVLIFLCFTLESFKKYFIFIKSCEYNVIVLINDNPRLLKGFMDTGNMADYQGIPIVYLNSKYYNNNKENYLVLIETVNGNKECKGYIDDNFILIVKGKRIIKKVMIIYTEMEKDCLLNPMMVM